MGELMHTPGPWRIAPNEAEYIATSSNEKISEWLNSSGSANFSALSIGTEKGSVAIIPLDESSFANAKLISAAPELLAALIEMVKGDELAIQEAEEMGVPFPESMLASYRMAVAAIAKATNG
jgi:hypothetical protein